MLSIYLPQLDSDNDLPDLCNYPIYSDEFDGLVLHVQPPYTVYVQSKRFDSQQQMLLDELYTAYESGGMFLSILKSANTLKEKHSLANFQSDSKIYFFTFFIPVPASPPLNLKQTYIGLSSDGNAYRCLVKQIHADNTAKVRWIDYGNEEMIQKTTINDDIT